MVLAYYWRSPVHSHKEVPMVDSQHARCLSHSRLNPRADYSSEERMLDRQVCLRPGTLHLCERLNNTKRMSAWATSFANTLFTSGKWRVISWLDQIEYRIASLCASTCPARVFLTHFTMIVALCRTSLQLIRFLGCCPFSFTSSWIGNGHSVAICLLVTQLRRCRSLVAALLFSLLALSVGPTCHFLALEFPICKLHSKP